MTRLTVVPLAAAVALAALLAGFSGSADAQWKWKDKGGRVQYSDLPPPSGTPDQDILSRPSSRAGIAPRTTSAPLPAASLAAAASAPRPAASAVDPELEARRKKVEADAAAKQKAEVDRVNAAKAENCTRARTSQRTLDSGIRLSRANDKGEREFLDDKQRADESKRVRDVIAADCK